MSGPFKVSTYVLLVLIASFSGYYALSAFGEMMSRAGERHSKLEQIEPERKTAAETEAAGGTNNAATNETVVATNAVDALTNGLISTATNTPAGVDTNSAATSVTGKVEGRVR